MNLQHTDQIYHIIRDSSSEIPIDVMERVLGGKTTVDDAFILLKCEPDVIFRLADMLRSSLVGNTVTFIVNRNINFSNRCIGTCRFCAFRDNKGFRMSLGEILDRAQNAVINGATEVCIQGALLPDMYLEDYLGILRTIKSRYPQLHIHAFSPMEVYHMARNSKTSIEDTLLQLKKAGLGSIPGTAAEILVQQVRNKICPDKITVEQWLEITQTAHKLGIYTTATMMYGHIETMEERIQHLLTVRDLQIRTGGITEFVPLPFMPHNNPLGEQLMADGYFATTGIEDLIVHAMARILLFPYVKNIQASWVKLGKKMAQYALFCGANDLGGTLMEERISRSAGSMNGEYMSPEEFKWLISGAGRIPVQRDTLYRHIDGEVQQDIN